MRKPPDKSDGVDEHDGSAVGQCQRTGCRVKRCEKLVFRKNSGIGQRVHERRFAGIGVADDCNRFNAVLLTPCTKVFSPFGYLNKLLLQALNPTANMPSVTFKLAFAGASCADSAAEP